MWRPLRILILTPDRALAAELARLLAPFDDANECIPVSTADGLPETLADGPCAAAILDDAWGEDGLLRALNRLQSLHPMPPCIVLHRRLSLAGVVAAVKAGAADVIPHDDLPRAVAALHLALRPAERPPRPQAAQPEPCLSEATLRSLLERMPGLVIVLDEAARVLEVFTADPSLLWRPAAEIIGKSLPETVPPALAELVCAGLRRALESAQVQHLDDWFELDGERRWFSSRLLALDGPGPTRLLWVARDLTPEKQTEEALRRGIARYETLARIAPVGILLMDPEGRLQYVNDRLCQLAGRPQEALVGNHWRAVIHPEDAGWLEPQVQRSLERDLPLRTECRLVQPGGDIRWVVVQTMIERDQAGNSVGYVGTITDITDRRKAEEHREHLEAQLRQSQKMESIGQLAGGIAHDFNNLLQAILGYTDMAMLGLDERDQRRLDLLEVRHAAERATMLTQQLLAFSRRQILRMSDIALNDLIQNLLLMLRPLLGEHIQVDFIAGRSLGTVRADAGQLEQVILNLCVNARDAMPDGGRLTIQTENVRLDGGDLPDHPWARPGHYVLLSVSDTGCGIAPDHLEHIFEPFFTTKEVGQGTGLGLAMVHGIINQHGGIVRADSAAGIGTTLKIYLPVAERRAAADGPRLADSISGGSETILVAEDEPRVRGLVRRLLEGAGYRVLLAADGREAVEMARSHAGEFQLTILDVVMPRMNGREVREAIRRNNPAMKFLFSSGYSAGEGPTDFLIGDEAVLIQKPYDAGALLRTVRAILDQPPPTAAEPAAARETPRAPGA